MKKFVSLLTALVLVLSLTACGGKSDTPAPSASTDKESDSPFAGKTVSVMTPPIWPPSPPTRWWAIWRTT